MQQRRLRLGDILDDYCPRERRITNHAVVAMIDEQVKQTRCTTCDADHEYKGGHAPSARRRKDGGGLTEMLDGPRAGRPADAQPSAPVADAAPDVSELSELTSDLELEPLADPVALAAAIAEEDEPSDIRDDDGPVHRPLIRATLPRPEGHVPERKEPDFTVRQSSGGRGGDGNRPGGHSYGGQGGGFGGGGQRPGRNRRHGRGAGAGQNSANGQQRFGAPRQDGQRNGSGPGAGRGPQDGNRPAGPRGQGRPDQRNPGRKRGR